MLIYRVITKCMVGEELEAIETFYSVWGDAVTHVMRFDKEYPDGKVSMLGVTVIGPSEVITKGRDSDG